MQRREFIVSLLYGISLLVPKMPWAAEGKEVPVSENIQGLCIPLDVPDEEWKAKLSPEEYEILRKARTERAFTSPLNAEKRAGEYHCAGCGTVLFSSDTKYESGSGWPSFFQPVNESVLKYETDYFLGYPRKEVLCATCGGHLGHVFDDGPKPTGKRFCMNGVALKFVPIAENPPR